METPRDIWRSEAEEKRAQAKARAAVREAQKAKVVICDHCVERPWTLPRSHDFTWIQVVHLNKLDS